MTGIVTTPMGFDDTDWTPEKQAETKVAAQALDALAKSYPGYMWHVTVEFSTGLCTVRTEFDSKYGFHLHLAASATSSEFEKQVVWAGGELLERLSLSREGYKQGEVDGLELDRRGNAIGDRS